MVPTKAGSFIVVTSLRTVSVDSLNGVMVVEEGAPAREGEVVDHGVSTILLNQQAW